VSALSDPVVLVLLVGIMLGIGTLVATLMHLASARTKALALVAKATAAPSGDRRTRRLDEALAASPVLRRAVEVTADLARRKGALGSVERSLRAADVPVRPAELILAHLVASIVLPVVVLIATMSVPKAVFALVVAGLGPPMTLRFLAGRRRKSFGNQLPDVLTGLSGSLRAGRSIGQAMEAMSREVQDPVGRELRKVVAEVRLGRTLHDALTDAAERVGSDDFRWAVLAMQIQAEVGGNLAELLDQVASTMRERTRMRLEVKALTAEGRASALMLVILVPALGGAMAAMNAQYMAPLFSTSTGRIMLGICVVMIGSGYFWMNSMVKIDV
jgi:tight adherence protein B